MPLVPESFAVPERLQTPDFVIRRLTAGDTDLDYRAVMSSVDVILKTRGGDWPSAGLTYDEDHQDLTRHEQEFAAREAFAYTVLSPDERECLGCLYFYPPGFRGKASADADVDVSFWVTQTAYDKGLYGALFVAIGQWLGSWPFRKVAYSNAVLP